MNIRNAKVFGIDQIWLINLDRRPGRLERFMQRHPEMSGRINRLSAYDGQSLELTPALARLFAPNDFDWHKPTMGCALSHLSLWYKLAGEADENASYLILEDDALLDPSWVATAEKSFFTNSVPADWEVLFLGGILPKYRETFEKNVQAVNRMVARVNPEYVFGNNPRGYFHFCAYAYLLNKRGAQRLLELVEGGNGVWMQADFFACYTTPDLSPPRPLYFINPLLAESFQDSAQGFAKPYDDGTDHSEKVDSDIWKKDDRFTMEEIAAFPVEGLPLDIPAALGQSHRNILDVEPLPAATATATSPASGNQSAASDNTPEEIMRADLSSSKVQSCPPSAISQIWLINLERRQDRLEKFKATHPDLADAVRVLKAYDGKQLRLTPKIARLFAPNDFKLNKAMMGCGLSHLDIWLRLAGEQDDDARYLVLEDDVILDSDAEKQIASVFANKEVPDDWDVLYLGGSRYGDDPNLTPNHFEHVAGSIYRCALNSSYGQNLPTRFVHFGAYAYLLNKRGAVRTLDLIKRRNGIWDAVDDVLAYRMSPGDQNDRNIYCFFPHIASYYQKEKSGYAKAYSNENTSGSLDSDIFKTDASFDKAIVRDMIVMSEPYDIAGALADARNVPAATSEERTEAEIAAGSEGKLIEQNLGHMVCEGHLGGFFSEGDGGTYYPLMWTHLVRKYGIRSVLDVGCGRGYSALYFQSLGCKITGIDGSEEAAATQLLGNDFVRADYSVGPSGLAEGCDLVWSCEFVEHVEEKFMANYLQDFRKGKYLAMTFAGPGQPGHHHVNCRPAEYWIRRLYAWGFDFLSDETTELREKARQDMEKNDSESDKRFVYHFMSRGLFFKNTRNCSGGL